MFAWLKKRAASSKDPERKKAKQAAAQAETKRQEKVLNNVADVSDRFNRARYMDQDGN